MTEVADDVVAKYGLIEVVNVSGTMTALGSSSVRPEVVQDVAGILPKFVDMRQLQQRASEIISEVIGSEAGCVTASAASGLVIATAACMTGTNLARVEQLPNAQTMKDEVVIQKGHVVWYGASVEQLIRLAGARPVEIGDATRAGRYQLEGAINQNTAAAMYVVSHHTVQYGLIGLEQFCDVAHYHDVPVIVDAASESGMTAFIESGADIVSYSGHKFLAGPTSGIVAGRRDLIQACYMHQNAGIGRAMKVGKEGIVGAISALRRWQVLDHRATSEGERQIVELFIEQLDEVPGLAVTIEADATGNPIDRARVVVDEQQAGLSAYQISRELRKAAPPIVVRAHHAFDEDLFYLDPCNVDEPSAKYVIAAIRSLLGRTADQKARIRNAYQDAPNGADAEEQAHRKWLM